MTLRPGLEIRRLCRVAAMAAAMCILLLATLPLTALTQTKVVPFKNYVNDYVGIIPDRVESQLNILLKQLERKTGAQIAVVIINSTEGVPAADYAVEYGQKAAAGEEKTTGGKTPWIAFSGVGPSAERMRAYRGIFPWPRLSPAPSGASR